ncbi:hypothetical protein [Pyrococcus kukulkanii]|uniref:hypothetical protein n=1 Tax=Pyrococcus kukulkanii TaxID=1609559 RepID=UPI0035676AE2
MGRLEVKLVFVGRGEEVEVEIDTTEERVNEDVSIVLNAMEERGYRYLKGELRREREGGE